MNEKTVPEIAARALEVLGKDGWCKWMTTNNAGGLYPVGSHCLGGALNLAYGGCSEMWYCPPPLYRMIADLIGEQYPEWRIAGYFPPVSIITAFNDHAVITETDVRRILEKLAAG
jgi:hypothetical protein